MRWKTNSRLVVSRDLSDVFPSRGLAGTLTSAGSAGEATTCCSSTRCSRISSDSHQRGRKGWWPPAATRWRIPDSQIGQWRTSSNLSQWGTGIGRKNFRIRHTPNYWCWQSGSAELCHSAPWQAKRIWRRCERSNSRGDILSVAAIPASTWIIIRKWRKRNDNNKFALFLSGLIESGVLITDTETVRI